MPENIPAPEAVAISLREHIEGRISAMNAYVLDAIRRVEEHHKDELVAIRALSVDRLEWIRRELVMLDEKGVLRGQRNAAAIERLQEEMAKAMEVMAQRSEERQDALRRELSLIQTASAAAVEKAEKAQQLRNEAMNEWRSTLTDVVAKYAERREIDALTDNLRSKMEAIEKATDMRLKQLEQKGSSQTGYLAGAAAMVALALALVGLIIRFLVAK